MMRHALIEPSNCYTAMDRSAINIAANDLAVIWPTTAALAPVAVPEVDALADQCFSSEPAAPDVPVAVGRMIVVAYGALIAAFMLSMAGSGESTFAILVSALFVTIFFTVPRLFFHIEPRSRKRPALARFMDEGIDTLTGHTGGSAALAQMLIVPCLLTLAILAMGAAMAVMV